MQDDYCAAVEQGRENSDADPMSYFVDDENSQNLFMGYSVAGERLKAAAWRSRIYRLTGSIRCSSTSPAVSAARRAA